MAAHQICLTLGFFFFGALAASAAEAGAAPSTVKFAGKEYLHRWSKDGQHEYTPEGQEDLEKWTDMLTVHYYKAVKDGAALASTANATLQNYHDHGARVLRTDSVPRTGEREAEHLIVALFARPKFIECVFSRFVMSRGKGMSFIYSHRVYGEKSGPATSTWLKENGPAIEKKIMSLSE